MGKKIKCTSTPRGRESKDQGGKKSKVVQLYTPLHMNKLILHLHMQNMQECSGFGMNNIPHYT